ncbi:MAG: ATP-binding protein [Desulfovibrionaceae bacterium]|nr:ATP-binding protein [Desulfovibrionaceae bacterium]
MHTIRIKLLAPFILGTLALTLVLTWYAYNSARQSLADAVLLISEAKSAQASSAISLLFKSMFTTMQNMVADPHILTLFAKPRTHDSVNSARHWLEAITHGNEYYRDILIVDAAGTCIASSNPEQIGNDYADKPTVQQALHGVFNFDEISVGRVTKKFSATASGPIDGTDGIVGALVLIADFPKIVDYEAISSHDSHTIFTALMNPQGSFIAHKNPKLMGNASLRFPELYTRLSGVGAQGGVVEYTLEGRMFIGFAQLENASRTLVITSGIRDDVFAPAYTVGFALFFISLLFLCTISFIVFRFANGILSALLSLIQYAKRVSEGDLELQLEKTARKDELGILHNALRNLVNVLQTALYKSNEAGRMKGEFLANMSHEIRTPLNAIIGMAHLSLRAGDLSAKQLVYLEKIQLSARSLLGVINDVLDISKVEAGMLGIESIPFNMKETAENTLAIHQENALNKGLILSLEYSADVPVFLVGDSLRIGQILNNLLGNAIKFTDQGSVSVRCWEEPSDIPDTAIIHVSVTDTGIGMSQNVIDMLFQPFTQADASISRKFGGTGLGLAISKRIIELMEGEISAESEEGRGSTFSFFMKLPLAEQQHAVEDTSSLAAAFEHLDIRTRRILVAEDNPINQFLLQEMLEPSGVHIVLANNGEEALEAVKAQSFDLVLMDMQMPVMGGLEATMKIRELPTAKSLPIIAVTANAMEDDKDKGLACGMNAYLTKPIDPVELLRALRIWLTNERNPAAAQQ